MTDVYPPEKRKWLMRRVRNRNTEPEVAVRSFIHKMGFRFRLHRRDLPGSPDIVLPRHRKVIFVSGCFWHGHPGCPRAALPQANASFWARKIEGNIARDKRTTEALEALGWRVLVVWGCEAKRREVLASKLRDFLMGECEECS